jgi:hypothetical protein
MKKHVIGVALLVFTYAASSAAFAQQAVTAEQIAGAWKFHSGVAHDSKTNADTPLPIRSGLLTFVQVGKNLRMTAIVAIGDRKPAGPTPADSDAAQLYKSFTAYSGLIEIGATATAEGTPVTNNVDIALNPSMPGKLQRLYRIDGSTLTVILPGPDGETDTTTWDKAQ